MSAGPPPPNQLLEVDLDAHEWWGVELRRFAMRAGNAELSTRQASSTLPWFFMRTLAFKGQTFGELSAFLASCRYVDDVEQFRRPEWWMHPVEFEELRRGDCEDHALFAWRVLHQLGHDVRLMVGLCRGVSHAWVQHYADGRSYVLEATAKHDVRADGVSDYVPEFSFLRTGEGAFKVFGHKPETIKANPVAPLSLSKHWLEIDRLIYAGKKNDAHRAIRIAMQGKGSYTRQFLDRYFYLREHHPDAFELDDEAYWADWRV